MEHLIVLIVSILATYLLYKFFNWLLIDRNPTLNMDQSVHKPNFFTSENKKLTKKDLKNQDNFTLTEISKGTQIFDKTTQNDSIGNNIFIYDNKETKSAHWGV